MIPTEILELAKALYAMFNPSFVEWDRVPDYDQKVWIERATGLKNSLEEKFVNISYQSPFPEDF